MKKILNTKTCMAGLLAATLFALFALTPATSAPVVVIPGEGAGYIYYGASSGAAEPAPAETGLGNVGMIAAFWKLPLPENWVECNGGLVPAQYPELIDYLGGPGARVPDLRGYFLRGHGSHGVSGVSSGPLAGRQDDAARRILGTLGGYIGWNVPTASGPFTIAQFGTSGAQGGSSYKHHNLTFDSSRVMNTANENRPHNIAVIYAIKAK